MELIAVLIGSVVTWLATPHDVNVAMGLAYVAALAGMPLWACLRLILLA